ncbi:MAG: pimeloyl-ACP methyl ester esterase BioH [Pseudomonadota bacterium]
MTLAVSAMGSGPELVLLHGWGMNSTVWAGFSESLAERYRLWLIDLPGHGDSPYSGERTLADWASACLAVAPQRAVWLGWSLGAEVVLQAALQQPERVSAVIGLSGTPRFVQGDDWLHAMAPRTLEQFITASRQDHRRTLERFLALQVRGSETARDNLRLLKQQLRLRPDPRPEALDAGLGLLKTVDLRKQLAELSCPTGWLYGERDTLVPVAGSETLGRWLPEARIRVIGGAAHAPFLSHRSETTDAVFTLLEPFHAL